MVCLPQIGLSYVCLIVKVLGKLPCNKILYYLNMKSPFYYHSAQTALHRHGYINLDKYETYLICQHKILQYVFSTLVHSFIV